MKKTLLIASLLLAAAFYAAAQRTPESVLGQALHQEEVEGDLKGAIATYQKVAAMKGVSHKTAAEALLHLGRCYERLGDNDARKVYERIEHDYADQTGAVATARARLARSRASAGSGIALTRVWSSPASNGAISPDGRYLSYKTSEALMLRDLLSGENHVLVKAAGRFIGKSFFSPDGKRIAYVNQNDNGPFQLNVINVNGTNDQTVYRTPEYFMPEGWSPSGEILIAVSSSEPNQPLVPVKMAWISVANGKERVLTVPHRIYVWPVALSPDGRSIAYTGINGGSDRETIYVLSADGSREFPLVESRWQDQALAWTEDGKAVLFSSDRTGSIGIWLAQIGSGSPKGTPMLIQDSIAKSATNSPSRNAFSYLNAVVPIGMTNKGAFFYDVSGTSNQMYYVDVDPSTGRASGEPTPVGPSNDRVNVLPAWSPDSRQLAYHSILGTVAGENSRRLLHIYSPETHVQRDLNPAIEYLGSKIAWFGDSTSLLAWGSSAQGQHGLYKVDTRSGKAEMLVPGDGATYLALAKDDKTIYYTESADGGGRPGPRILNRSLATGEQKILYEAPQTGLGPIELSPDNGSLAFRATSNGMAIFMVMPVAGGQPREVFRTSNASINTGYGLAWSADGRFLFISWTRDANTPPGLYRIPVEGGAPQDMGIPMQVDSIAVRPDGRGIAFNALPTRQYETWMMDNLPH